VVVPEFNSEGSSSAAFNQGEEVGSSLMERADVQRIADERARQQQEIFDATFPAIQAKQQADAAVAQNQLAEIQNTQNLRQQYLPLVNKARKEFHDAQMIPDIAQRAQTNTEWLGKYAPIANLPEYQQEFQTYQHLGTQTTQDWMKVTSLNAANALLQQKNQALLEMAGMKNQTAENVAKIRGQSMVDASSIRAAASQKNAQTRANAPDAFLKNVSAYADAVARGDDASAGMIENYLQSKSGLAPTAIADTLTKMAANEQKLADVAKSNGDEEAYKQRLANADRLEGRAQAILQPQKPETAPTVPSTEPPPSVEPSAKESGKLYSINPETKQPFLSASVKSPQDILKAVQQMHDDKLITPEQGDAILLHFGFKPKQ